jgi:hypothetical protein
MAAAWCAARRRRWRDEWGARRPDQVSAALLAEPARYERLEYAADTGDLPDLGLPRVLYMHAVDFLRACPRFRAWRLRQAGGAVDAGRTGLSGAAAVSSAATIAAAVAAAGGVRAPGEGVPLVELRVLEAGPAWQEDRPPGW